MFGPTFSNGVNNSVPPHYGTHSVRCNRDYLRRRILVVCIKRWNSQIGPTAVALPVFLVVICSSKNTNIIMCIYSYFAFLTHIPILLITTLQGTTGRVINAWTKGPGQRVHHTIIVHIYCSMSRPRDIPLQFVLNRFFG